MYAFRYMILLSVLYNVSFKYTNKQKIKKENSNNLVSIESIILKSEATTKSLNLNYFCVSLSTLKECFFFFLIYFIISIYKKRVYYCYYIAGCSSIFRLRAIRLFFYLKKCFSFFVLKNRTHGIEWVVRYSTYILIVFILAEYMQSL